MSPVDDLHLSGGDGFPRVSGDEPLNGDLEKLGGSFSPRERG